MGQGVMFLEVGGPVVILSKAKDLNLWVPAANR